MVEKLHCIWKDRFIPPDSGQSHAGDAAAKTRKQYQSKVDAINALEPSMQALSDEQLRDKTKELQNKCQDGKTLDDLLVEAFAVCTPERGLG